jgi:uncharacterized membrane protein HdeD (DUF308 family)
MKKRLQYYAKNWAVLCLGIMALATGALLLFYPTESMQTLCYIMAVTTAIVGIALMVQALSFPHKKAKYLLFIFAGALSFACGILLCFAPLSVFLFYTAIIGLLMTLNGGFFLREQFAQKKRKVLWWIKLCLGLLVVLGGFLCIRITNSDASLLAKLFGATLVLNGVMNCLSYFTPSLPEKAETAPSPLDITKE